MNEETLLLVRYLIRGGKITESDLDGLLETVDLSATKLLTLAELVQADEPLQLSQLAACLAFAKSNATQLIDRLESERMVRRVPAAHDRRCIQLEVTAEGQARYETALADIQPLLHKLDTLYTPEERIVLLGLLKRLGNPRSQ